MCGGQGFVGTTGRLPTGCHPGPWQYLLPLAAATCAYLRDMDAVQSGWVSGRMGVSLACGHSDVSYSSLLRGTCFLWQQESQAVMV